MAQLGLAAQVVANGHETGEERRDVRAGEHVDPQVQTHLVARREAGAAIVAGMLHVADGVAHVLAHPRRADTDRGRSTLVVFGDLDPCITQVRALLGEQPEALLPAPAP